MTQTPVAIQHPPAQRITLHAVGVAAFVLMGGVLSHTRNVSTSNGQFVSS
jgi:hypothetical protein